MLGAYNYLIHLLSGFVLLSAFFWLYTEKITPFHEITLIRNGNMAAACSLAGAVIGYTLTLASSITHNDSFFMFLAWGFGGLVVQAICYAIMTRLMPQMNEAIVSNNIAMGALMGLASLSLGILNAACMS